MDKEEFNRLFRELMLKNIGLFIEQYYSQPVPKYPKGGFVNRGNGLNINALYLGEAESIIAKLDGGETIMQIKPQEYYSEMTVVNLNKLLSQYEKEEKYDLCIKISDEINSRK